MSTYQVVAYSEKPDLLERMKGAEAEAFPEFINHDPVWDRGWSYMLQHFRECQLFLYDPAANDVLAMINSIPFRWDGTVQDLPAGTHDALSRSVREHGSGDSPTTLCVVQAIVRDKYKGRGLSQAVMAAQIDLALQRGFQWCMSPIRPALKASYPLTPMERYVQWRREDGLPFDPWLRVQHHLGGEILRVCNDSLVITGTLGEWESWTQMKFPESGQYVIPGGLVPLTVNKARDEGHYSEPHVWVRFPPLSVLA